MRAFALPFAALPVWAWQECGDAEEAAVVSSANGVRLWGELAVAQGIAAAAAQPLADTLVGSSAEARAQVSWLLVINLGSPAPVGGEGWEERPPWAVPEE